MKVSFVLPFFARRASGGVKVIYEYSNYLVSSGHQVVIYYTYGNMLSDYAIPAPLKSFMIKYIIEKSTISWFSLDNRVKRKSIKEIVDSQIDDGDVVIATAVKTAKPVLLLGQEKGAKVYFIQGFENWSCKNEEVIATYKFKIKKIVVAKWLKEIVDRYSEQESILIDNSIDLNVFNITVIPEERDNHSIVFQYRSQAYKGPGCAKKVIDILYRKYPDLHVFIVSNEKQSCSFPECCSYFYNLTPNEVAEVNNRARIFMCTRVEEGFGLPGLEAMACGCILASTEYKGVLEYAINGENALLSPINDFESLADNISRIFEDSDLRSHLLRNSINKAKERTIEASGLALENILISLQE